MQTLERAIAIAAEAHAGQIDRIGAPYILHPLRLMMKMDSMAGMIVAVLHDVVEDNIAWTLPRLQQEGFGREIIDGVDAMTRRQDETYPQYILRVAGNKLAKTVKMHDLEDNINIRKFTEQTEEDRNRIRKYESALNTLKAMREDAS
jgi:(p)ppGpp synthase/HD superfamily hydrolase